MRGLNKILGVGTLALVSLIGCTRFYEVEGKKIYYNEGDVNPMVVMDDSAKKVYQTKHKDILTRTAGKDITKVKIAKAKKPLFKSNEIKYSNFPKVYSEYNEKDSSVMEKERANFDYYLIKIDSVDNSRRRENGK